MLSIKNLKLNASTVRLLLVISVIVIPFLVGLNIRLNDLNVWNKSPHVFFYDGRPLFTSYDGFRYARYAKEYREGTYNSGERDPLRFYPDNYLTNSSWTTYPNPIPMESWLGAKLSQAKNVHVENVALWLTPLLGVLFVIPLTLFFLELKLPLSGFSGALLGAISLLYLIRTSIVRFDTDSLNLFFPFISAFFFLKSLRNKSRLQELIYAGLGGLCLNLFVWWYDHPGLSVVLFSAYLISFIFTKTKSERLTPSTYLPLIITVLFANPFVLAKGINNLIGSFLSYTVVYSKKAVHGGFPNVQMSISELKHFSLKSLSKLAAGSELILILGLIGIVLFFIIYWRTAILILPVFLIGLLSFKGANRFAMYLSPFIGIGIGFLADYAINKWSKESAKTLIQLLLVVLILATFSFSNADSFKYVAKPKITPALAGDFLKLKDLTPKNAQIWTWWDYGYAIQYYGERGTFHDGGSQFSPKTYFVATTFSTDDPKQAYNTILAISNIGAKGINKLLKEKKDPEVVRDEIFSGKHSKPLKDPVYWAFTEDEIGKFMWINFFGTWDFDLKKGLKNPIFRLPACRKLRPNVFACGNLIMDLNKGNLLQGKKITPIKKLIFRNEKKLLEKDFHPKGWFLEIVNKNRRSHIFLMNRQAYNSMFNQMYILRKYDKNLFELVYDNFPTMVLYRVK